MCGIAGIIGRIGDNNRDALRRMADRIAHRGPDSTGYFTSSPDDRGFGCLFAHRRLSILDLSTAADQPMTDPVGGQTLIFNGEIYNFRELRQELIARGQSFTSSGDTAVMLRALAVQGEDAVRKFRGMFAYALWDDKSRTLMLARDPLGIKPLYIAINPDPNGNWSLLFASEIRAILASGLLGTPRLNRSAIATVIWNGFVAGPQTIVDGIEEIGAGQYVTFDRAGRVSAAVNYWTIEPPNETGRVREDELRHALRESVRLHLVSDVPLGVFLSSGVDSSAVANLAQKVSDQPINTFTLAFEDPQLNEADNARRIAQAIGTKHHEIVLTEQRFVSNLERALDTLDQPTFDALNTFYMSQAVREAGLTVALVGTGGDELFGGYKSFRELPSLLSRDRMTSFVPRTVKVLAAKLIARLMAGGGGDVGPQTRWAKLPDMMRSADDLIGLYQLAYALFLPGFQRALLADPSTAATLTHGLPPQLLRQLRHEIGGRSVRSAIGALEQRLFLGQRLLRDSDTASMAVSLEMRLPLVDQVLFDTVSRMDDDLRFNPIGRKQMLRKIGLEGLDPQLFERPKSGFVLPFDRWIRQGLGDAMNATMNDGRAAANVGLNGETVRRLWRAYNDGAPGMYWSRVWAIYVLMRWSQRNGVTL